MPEVKILSRLQSIDALRGLVIVIMLLDHVRETFYLNKQVTDPMNIMETEPALFGSRALAHICAPIFVLLTGLSAYLYQLKNNNLASTRSFLFKRGLFLILLELTLVNFAWTAKFPPDIIYLQVIWAIGISMLVLALCVGLPRNILLGAGLLIIFGHNLLDQITFRGISGLEQIWFVLHERGWIEFETLRIRTSYPVLPWFGVIFVGYALGYFFEPRFSTAERQRYLLTLGIISIVLFLALRSINIYGDHPWSFYDSWMMTVMSFFNLTKYPPSLLFILWNVGLGLIFLALFEILIKWNAFKPLIVFGSVPMFFYLLHLFILKLFYVICIALIGTTDGNYFAVNSVAALWFITLLLTVLLYPLVAWFSKFKHKNKQITWLKYF
ncbi:DUF1624 domain-containing protein [Acinetobacter zhairhuonensis]|uniref:DUF1624 domain-containing protein n=1 Tax=Acinetobacter sp. A7.4 TaxID=2919921 RepID=UPI001F4F4C40|nr:heparan-alpha-glucosaminide N-acetyltransferase domain-containing protein [Acinetobacter sp. A7.4]MCJ8161253.1 heparan-alpha-glucosaminide N-acetyltransferase domain-containing protein [Acinetobacter sp. A7.4]